MIDYREVQAVTRRQIGRLWDAGHDTYEIAKRLGMDEPRVSRVVRDHVTAKRFQMQPF